MHSSQFPVVMVLHARWVSEVPRTGSWGERGDSGLVKVGCHGLLEINVGQAVDSANLSLTVRVGGALND